MPDPVVYNRHKFRAQNGDFNPAATIRMLLTQQGLYVPDPDHNTLSDVAGEVTTTNYTRRTLTGVQVVEDDAGDRSRFTADLLTMTSLGNNLQTAAYAIYFERLAGADSGTDPLIAALPFNPAVLLDGNDLRIQPHVSGLVTAN